ncbi:MAG TPA: carboxypeptidase-like regulatory domain-containing protein [Vicinamibacterales bacterium]
MKSVAVATVLVSAVVLTVAAQSPRDSQSAPSTPSLQISGRVVAEQSGDPIPNARVTLIGARTFPTRLTDGSGRFSSEVPPGRYRVVVSKTAYARQETSVDSAEPIEIRLAPGAVVTGRVTNPVGDPVVGVQVVVEVPGTAGARGPATASAQTDDLGEYRLSGLSAGTYAVAAIAWSAPTTMQMIGTQVGLAPGLRRTYYPGGSSAAEAELIRLQAGEERSSIDFLLASGQAGFGSYVMPPRTSAREVEATAPRGVIRGHVVSTGDSPVSHARVTLTRMMTSPRLDGSGGIVTTPQFVYEPHATTADDDGGFEFRNLPPGTFVTAAEKVGYTMKDLPGGTTSPPPGAGITTTLIDGETNDRLEIRMSRWGAIAGRILDELGEPLSGVRVQALQVRYERGRRRLAVAGGVSEPTDDLGRFRIFAVAPGQYIISGAVGDVSSADVPGYARSYYPGTSNPGEAQFVALGLSQQMSGVEFSMSRERTALISGTLLNGAGVPGSGGSLKLLSSRASMSAVSVEVGARIQRDRFEFPNVPPGQYVIQADRGRRGSSIEGEFGAIAVSVDGTDITNLTLQTTAGSSIAGRITFVGTRGAQLPAASRIEITPVPTDSDQSPRQAAVADIARDWTFSISGIHGPRRLQVLRLPAEWTLREIRVNGIDVTDRPLAFGRAEQSLNDVEIVLIDRVNELLGTVNDDHGRPAAGSHVIVFSTDRDRWYPASRFLRQSTTAQDGTVKLSGLPEGSFYVAVVPRLPADGDDAWQEPAYLESLMPRVSSVAFGEGDSKSMTLTLDAR